MARRLKSPGTVGSPMAINSPNVLILDSEDAAVTRVGSWSSVGDAEAVGGSYLQSNIKGDYLQFSFKGSALWIRFKFGSNCGKASITIDDKAYPTIDLYSDLAVFKYVNVVVGLDENVSHMVKIGVAGTKNASSTDYYVNVDAFMYRTTEEALSLQNIEYIDLINVINTINRINEIKIISNIANIDLVKEISIVDNIDNVANISNIQNISAVQKLSLITEISNVGNIANISTIQRINPTESFTEAGSLNTGGNIMELMGLAVYGDYLYVAASGYTAYSPLRILKIHMPSFTLVDILQSDTENNAIPLAVGVVSNVGTYLFVGTYKAPGEIVKIDLSTFAKVGVLSLASGENYILDLAVSGSYIYAACDTSPAQVVKVNMQTLSEVATLSLVSPRSSAGALIVDGNYLYVGCSTAPGIISKVDLSTFTEVATLSLASGENYICDFAVSGSYLYASCGTSPGKVVKIDLANFTRMASLTLASGENNVTGLAVLEPYLYAVCRTAPGKIAKIDLATFSEVDSLTLATGEDNPYEVVISGDYLYTATDKTSPLCYVVKVNLPALNVVIDKINGIGAIEKIGNIELIKTISTIQNLLNPHPVKLTPEDKLVDANQFSGTFSPTAAGSITIIAAVTGLVIRVYDFSLWNSGSADVTVELYFGTSGKRLFRGLLAPKAGVLKTFVRPWESNAGDSLVLALSAAGTCDYCVGAVQA